MNPDRWDTWAPNQSKVPHPARPNVTVPTKWPSFAMLTLGCVASATFLILFATKPPQEPLFYIFFFFLNSNNQTYPSPCPNTPTAFMLHPGCAWLQLHRPAFQFVYPSNLKIKTKHRQHYRHVCTHISLTSSLRPSLMVSEEMMFV